MFQKNKIESLIKRAVFCKPNIRSLKNEAINEVAKRLGVCFAEDFYQINEKCDYEGFYGAYIEFCCFFIHGNSGVVEETLELRQNIHLPHHYVVLSDMGDGGSVLLETQNSSEKPSPVIWCDYEDLHYMCDKGNFVYNPTIWPSFMDFFEYLVEQEEEMLKEQRKKK